MSQKMKPLKQSFKLNSKLGPMLLFCMSLIFAVAGQALNPQPTQALTITGLKAYASQNNSFYLSAFYAAGYVSSLSLQQNSDELYLYDVYLKVQDIPITSDSVSLPAESVHWAGFNRPNVLVLVVHSRPNYTWLNTGIEGKQPDFGSEFAQTVTVSIGADKKPVYKQTPGIALSSNYNFVAFSTVAFRVLGDSSTYAFDSTQPLKNFLKALPAGTESQ